MENYNTLKKITRKLKKLAIIFITQNVWSGGSKYKDNIKLKALKTALIYLLKKHDTTTP